MAFLMVAFWAIVVTAVVMLVRSSHPQPHGDAPSSGSDPERILAERFARGEIDADEYTHRRDLLRPR